MCQDILVDNDPNMVYSDDDSSKFFYDHLIESTVKLLSEIYLCEVIAVESEKEGNRVFNVKLQYDTFKDRKKINFKSETTYESEQNLSKTMLDKKTEVDLDILLTMSTKNSGKVVDFQMVNRVSNPKSLILSFCNYISVNITSAMRYYLKQKWDSRQKTVQNKVSTSS